MRVHELAKELNMDSKTVIQFLRENDSLGTIKNHMSNVDGHQQGVVRLSTKLDTSIESLTLESFDDIAEVDNIEPSLYDVVKEDTEVEPIIPQGTSGTSAFPTYSDEDRLETEEEIKERKGTTTAEPIESEETSFESSIREMTASKKETEERKDQEDGELSFGQKAFAKAKSEEMTTAEKETEDSTEAWKKLARHDDDAEWTKKVVEADAKLAVQKVVVERSTGLWGWLKGLFS